MQTLKRFSNVTEITSCPHLLVPISINFVILFVVILRPRFLRSKDLYLPNSVVPLAPRLSDLLSHLPLRWQRFRAYLFHPPALQPQHPVFLLPVSGLPAARRFG